MKRETTVRINLRERADDEAITTAIRKTIRPWLEDLEAEGLTLSPPTFTLTPDPVDHWTTHVRVEVDVA